MKENFEQQNTIGDIMKEQGIKRDSSGFLKNKEGKESKINLSPEERKKEELAKMGYGPNGEILDKKKIKNYDPTTGEDYSHSKQFGNFVEKPGKNYSQEALDEFADIEENNMEAAYLSFEEKEEERKDDFENENIQKTWFNKVSEMKKTELKEEKEYYKNLPEYSDFEKEEMIKALENWLNNKTSYFADGTKMDLNQTLEMVNEFKEAFPTEYIKMINRKLIGKELGEFNWKKETFKDKNIMVSYYPNKQNPKIKYINQDVEFENLDKVYVNSSVNGEGRYIKDKNGCLLVFCSAPLSLKKQNAKPRIIKREKVS